MIPQFISYPDLFKHIAADALPATRLVAAGSAGRVAKVGTELNHKQKKHKKMRSIK